MDWQANYSVAYASFLPIFRNDNVKHVQCNAAAFRFNKWACGSEKTSIQFVFCDHRHSTWVLRKRI